MEAKELKSTPGNFHRNTRSSSAITVAQLLLIFKRYWYFFVISLPIALVVVNIHLRMVVPVYRASATLMYKSSSESRLSSTALMDGFGLAPETRDLENQIFLLKSYNIVKRTIDKLDFSIEYYLEERFKDTELYHSAPFTIRMDSGVPQLVDVPVRLQFTGDGKVRVTCEAENGNLYDFSASKWNGSSGAVKFDKVVAIGDKVETPFFAFTVDKPDQQVVGGDQLYYVKFRTPESVAYQFKGALGISPYSESSSILFLSVSGPTPEKLRAFLDRLCLDLIDYNLEQKNEIANRTMEFIQKQLAVISDTLERTQGNLINFKKENGMFEPSSTIKKFSEDYYDTEKSINLLNLKTEYFNMLNAKLKENPYGTDFLLPAFRDSDFPVVSGLVMDLLAQNNELKAARADANDNNPYLTTLQQKIEITRQNLLLGIDKMLESIQLQKDVLRREMVGYESQLQQLPDVERRYLKLERKYKLNDAIYTFLLQKNSETQISKASNAPDNEILDNASVSGIISPDVKGTYSKAVLLALAFPVGLIVLIEFLNVKVRLKDDLDQLLPNVPIIGIVPRSKVNGRICVVDVPHSGIAESFRTLRTRLNFLTMGAGSRMVVISSTDAGEGKTFLSVNLAAAFALSGKRTALLGLDLRKPKMADVFGESGKVGISNYLIGQASYEEICIPNLQNNLTILPSGDIPPNPSELIASDGMAVLMNRLRNDFDVIIVDTPPIGLVSDARLLMGDADAVLYVVRCNVTHKEHLKHTVQNLLDEDVKPIGVVFNDVDNSVMSYGSYSSEYYGKVRG